MQNKLFAAIAMIMIVMIGMTGFAAATEEAADVTVSIGDGTGDVTIPIIVENVTNLGVCHIQLTFDKTVVDVTGVADGDMNATFKYVNSAAGTVNVGSLQDNGIGLDGNVIVAYVTFAPVDECSVNTSDLNLSVRVLNEATNNKSTGKIPYNVANGMYTSGNYTGDLNGDANGDGFVDMYDAMYIASYVAQLDGYTITCPAIADVNGKDGVTITDATYLANYLMGDPAYSPLK